MTIAPEEMLLRQILDLAAMTGWRAFHVSNSTREITRKSGARVRVRNVNPQGVGFPDLVLVHPKQKRTLYRELKDDGKYPTPEQRAWMDDLIAAGNDVAIWKPKDWSAILATLAQEERG